MVLFVFLYQVPVIMKRHFASSALFGSAWPALLACGVLFLTGTARAQDIFEPDDTAATARTIGNGQTQTHSLDVGDEDWTTFTIGSAGATNLRIETALTGLSGD